jgi:hypothetical protein
MQDPTTRRRIAIGAMVLCTLSSLAIFAIIPFAEAIGLLPSGLLIRKGTAAPFGLATGALLVALLLSRRIGKKDLLLLPRPFTLTFFLTFCVLPAAQSVGFTNESMWLRHRVFFALVGLSAVVLMVVASVAVLERFSKQQ